MKEKITQNERTKARYWERKGKGICTMCGRAPAEPGKANCRECAIIHSLYVQDLHNLRVSRGECVHCGKKKPEGWYWVLCPKCREAELARDRERTAKRIREGRCTVCGVKLPEGYSYRRCEECRAKQRKYHQKERA